MLINSGRNTQLCYSYSMGLTDTWTTYLNLTNIMLGKRSQTQKNAYSRILFLWRSKTGKTNYCNRNYNCVCLVVGLTEKVQEDTSRVTAVLSILTMVIIKTQQTVHLRFVNFTEYKYNLIKRIWKLWSKADVLNDYCECWHKLVHLIGKQYCYINQEFLRAFIFYSPFNKFPLSKSILGGYILNLTVRGDPFVQNYFYDCYLQ